MLRSTILSRILDFYLSSRDFNGMTLKALLDEVKATSHDVLEQLKRLVVEGRHSSWRAELPLIAKSGISGS